MDYELIRLAICDLQEKDKRIDFFSKEYLFDRKHAEHRNQVFFYGGTTMHRRRLSVLLREAMTEEHRKRLFPGNYDLGNMRSLLPKFCKYESKKAKDTTLVAELMQELWQENRLQGEQCIDSSGLKKIKAGIAELTGRTMEQHYAHNKSTALKVTKLLYRLSRDRWSSASENNPPKKPQIIAMLRWPNGKNDYSLSFRDAYAYKENLGQVWLIADLKSYLSIELPLETYENVGALQFFLYKYLRSTVHNVVKALSFMDYARQVKAYKNLAYKINFLVIDPQPINLSLDEDLYFYINALEFAHFAEGYHNLLEKSKTDCNVLPVFAMIDNFAKDLAQSQSASLHDQLISPGEFHDFMETYAELLSVIVGKAFSREILPSELKKTCSYVLNLLCKYGMFRKQWLNGDSQASLFSTLEFIAAVCCVYEEMNRKESERTKHKPYWKGQAAQGGSILTTLKSASFDQSSFIEQTPEEHQHIWANRLEWFMATLQGQIELKTQQFAFQSVLVRKVKEIARTNNLVSIHRNLSRLDLELESLISSSF